MPRKVKIYEIPKKTDKKINWKKNPCGTKGVLGGSGSYWNKVSERSEERWKNKNAQSFD